MRVSLHICYKNITRFLPVLSSDFLMIIRGNTRFRTIWKKRGFYEQVGESQRSVVAVDLRECFARLHVVSPLKTGILEMAVDLD